MNKPKIIILLISLSLLSTPCLLYAQKLLNLKILRSTRPITELRVEVANSPQERARGLMFRRDLPEGRGMWFIFDRDTSHPFWMKNTYISLDILYVDSNMEIVSFCKDAKPLSLKPLYSKRPYRYVLEVPAGFIKKHGLKLRDKIRMQTGI